LNVGLGQLYLAHSWFGFDIPIPAISISAHDPSANSSEDPSAGPSASASRTWPYKQKAPIDPSLPKMAKKTTKKPSGGINITGTKQKAPTSTPPLGFRKRSRSSDQKGILSLSTLFYHLLLIRKLPCRVPQDIPSASRAKNISSKSESPKVDKPLSPSARKNPSRDPETPGLRGRQCSNWCYK
jgi:hypothetical protein